MSNEFAKILEEAHVSDRRVLPSLKVLEEFCDGIQEWSHKKFACSLREGFISELGQEWKVTVRTGRRGTGAVLLRAHVQAGGYPVNLDFYEEDMVECKMEAALRAALQKFLRQTTTQDNLALLMREAERAGRHDRGPRQNGRH